MFTARPGTPTNPGPDGPPSPDGSPTLTAQDRFPFLGACLFTLGYLGVLALFAGLDVWGSHFFEGGPVYVLYHALRVIFLGYFFLICSTAGRLALKGLTRGKGVAARRLDRWLIHSYVGASLLVLVWFVLGLCMLYYQAIAIAFTAPLVFLSFGSASAVWRVRAELLGAMRGQGRLETYCLACLALLAVGLLAFHLLFRGLNADLGLDPIDHYAPNYVAVLNQHGVQPNSYYLQFFYTKGAGLHYLAALLTDVHSFQLANFCLSVLSMLALFRVVELSGGGRFWGLVAVVLWLVSPQIFVDEYQKLHVAMGSLIAFLAYFLLYWMHQEQAPRQGMVILSLVLTALTTLVPPCLVFVLPFLLIVLGMQRFHPARPPLYQIPLLLLSPLAAFSVSLLANYLHTGIFEFTPPAAWKPYQNPLRMEEAFWPSDYYAGYLQGIGGVSATLEQLRQNLSWQRVRQSLFDGVAVPSRWYALILFASFWLWAMRPGAICNLRARQALRAAASLLLITAVAAALVSKTRVGRFFSFDWLMQSPQLLLALIGPGLFWVWWRHRPAPSKHAVPATALAALVLLTLIGATTSQSSVERFSSFKVFFQVLLGVWVLALIVELAGRARWKHGVCAIAASIAVWFGGRALVRAARPHLEGITEAWAFASGQRSYAARFGPGTVELAQAIRAKIGPAEKVQVLNWQFFGLINAPGAQFFFHPPYFGDLDHILSGSPATARALLENKYGLRYFLLNLSPQAAIVGTMAYAPLFQEAGLAEHFEVASRFDGSIYLLTWRAASASASFASPDMDVVAGLLAERRRSDRKHFDLFDAWYAEYQRKGLMAVDRRTWDAGLPRLALFRSWSIRSHDERAAADFLAESFDPRSRLILNTDPGLPSASPMPCDKVHISREVRGRLEAEVNNLSAGVVLFQQPHTPFWHAAVDDEEVPVIRANGKYMAVAVPAGPHRLVFRYRDRHLSAAIALAAGAALLLVGMAALAYWGARPPSASLTGQPYSLAAS